MCEYKNSIERTFKEQLALARACSAARAVIRTAKYCLQRGGAPFMLELIDVAPDSRLRKPLEGIEIGELPEQDANDGEQS